MSETAALDSFHLGVKAIILNLNRKVLLLERNHPIKGLYWDLPGGRLQKGETPKETLFREIKEETGLKITGEVTPFATVLTDIRIPTGNACVGLIFSIFRYDLSVLFKPVLSNEHINYGWFTPIETSQKLKTQSQYPHELIKNLEDLTT